MIFCSNIAMISASHTQYYHDIINSDLDLCELINKSTSPSFNVRTSPSSLNKIHNMINLTFTFLFPFDTFQQK